MGMPGAGGTPGAREIVLEGYARDGSGVTARALGPTGPGGHPAPARRVTQNRHGGSGAGSIPCEDGPAGHGATAERAGAQLRSLFRWVRSNQLSGFHCLSSGRSATTP